MRRNTRESVVAARPPRTLARASTPVTRRSGIPNLQCTIVSEFFFAKFLGPGSEKKMRALYLALSLFLSPPSLSLSLLARSLALWACVCARAGAREPQARFSGRRTEPDVRRRRHVRQQDSSRVSPRPACDAGCSMLHARVVFGRGWACVWRGAGGRGDDGGAGWYALRNEEEASTDAVCSQDCPECRASKDVSHPRGPRLQGYPAPRLQGCPPLECSGW